MNRIILALLSISLLAAQGPVNRSSVGAVAASASGTAYTFNFTVDPGTYVSHQAYFVTADVANTGAATGNINIHGAKSIVKLVGGAATALVANDIRAGAELILVYDGTNLECAAGCNGNAPASSSSGVPLPSTARYGGAYATSAS